MRMTAPGVSFLGAPVQLDPGRVETEAALLGVPHGWAYPRPGTTAGCADAPAAVRRRSNRASRFVDHWDFDADARLKPRPFVDVGDVRGDPNDGRGNSRRTTEAVAAILESGAVPICLGGDDSVPIPILRAYEGGAPITVVQVDAHLDFRDEVDGVREGYSSPMRRASEMPHVERIIHVGLRGVGSAREADVADSKAAGNTLVTARELRERGVPWLLDRIPDGANVFLSFDCDGLDPSVMPAVSALAPGGLTYAEAWDLVCGVRSRIAGAVVTEYVPSLDPNELGAMTITRLVCALLQSA